MAYHPTCRTQPVGVEAGLQQERSLNKTIVVSIYLNMFLGAI